MYFKTFLHKFQDEQVFYANYFLQYVFQSLSTLQKRYEVPPNEIQILHKSHGDFSTHGYNMEKNWQLLFYFFFFFFLFIKFIASI